ncbi:hypothetical protein LCGC14_0855470 [marine sediment metagenome]|uniref:Uncharacterized protein n=1 Tax=marine sediment metagenome TaxID=412755 RepID=A0A0F9PDW0_9ZZZZ
MMSKKLLFNEKYDSYNEDGNILDSQTCKAIDPIFKKWVEKGYSLRDISHIVLQAVMTLECEHILTRSIKTQKEERTDKKKNESMIKHRVECEKGGYPHHESRYSCDNCKLSRNGFTCIDSECHGFVPKDEA